jgi:hypothetical protein
VASVPGTVLNASLARGHAGSLQQVQQMLVAKGRRQAQRRAGQGWRTACT